MRRFIRFNRLLLAGIVAAAAVLSLTQVAQAGPPPPVVPSKIRVGDGNKVFLVGHAVGVQIYSCNATSNGLVWGFVAPRAILYNDHGKLIITHFAGPTWQAKDGSRVVGRLVDFITVDPTAISWLCCPLRRPLALTAIGWWPRPTSNGSPPPAAWRPRPRNATRTPPTTTSGSGPAADATPLSGRATSGASRRPSAALAVADGRALVVAVALYAFGRTHTPSYAIGLLGHHGIAVVTRAARWSDEISHRQAGLDLRPPGSKLELVVYATRMKPH